LFKSGKEHTLPALQIQAKTTLEKEVLIYDIKHTFLYIGFLTEYCLIPKQGSKSQCEVPQFVDSVSQQKNLRQSGKEKRNKTKIHIATAHGEIVTLLTDKENMNYTSLTLKLW
jgi:hypothetical protein